MNHIVEKEYYSVTEVAKKFSINTITIYRMIVKKKIKAFKVGEQWRISREELKRIENEPR